MATVGIKIAGRTQAGALTVQSRTVRTRLASWLYTGPLGHLAAGVADWAELLRRSGRPRRQRVTKDI
jgi:hypothetical protein